MPELSRPLAATSAIWRKAIAPWAEQIAGSFLEIPLQLKSGLAVSGAAFTPRHRTPLTGRNRSRVNGSRGKSQRGTAPSLLPKRCAMCGVELEQSARKYCDTCLPLHTTSKLSAARARQITLRENGLDNRSSTENRAKRRASTSRQNAIVRAWKAKNPVRPSPDVFRNEIWPKLKGISLSKLVTVSGLSRSACQKIRRNSHSTRAPLESVSVFSLSCRSQRPRDGCSQRIGACALSLRARQPLPDHRLDAFHMNSTIRKRRTVDCNPTKWLPTLRDHRVHRDSQPIKRRSPAVV